MIVLAAIVALPLGTALQALPSGGSNVVSLKQAGEQTLVLRSGGHYVTARLSVAARAATWPAELVVGPAVNGRSSAANPNLIVTQVDIRVDGCRVQQPWPAVGGMSMPSAAILHVQNNRWEIEIDGPGDGAEDYNIRFVFDRHRILSRVLRWGPDYWETTRYDIQVDPAVAPQDCK